MVLALEQAAGSEHYDASPGSPPPLSNIPTLVGSRHVGGLQQPRDWAFVPAPYATSNYTGFINKHSSKPSSLGVSNGVEKKSGSPTHQAKVSLQMATSPSNGNILNSVAIQAHQYLDGTWSLSRTNGVTLYPYQDPKALCHTYIGCVAFSLSIRGQWPLDQCQSRSPGREASRPCHYHRRNSTPAEPEPLENDSSLLQFRRSKDEDDADRPSSKKGLPVSPLRRMTLGRFSTCTEKAEVLRCSWFSQPEQMPLSSYRSPFP
ncbi:PREDICTED: kinesin-like protein KIF26B [Colobus angolensis palliatus]|uniref:kinesin-like protein KIF26B n=1 Tax=Colobus angolensis palliatus TaxID=336983 RepID=UPI0005F47B91|nr:PREDICTED: kinesin-like protein KIF26B [Colobus angolensis palliatus]